MAYPSRRDRPLHPHPRLARSRTVPARCAGSTPARHDASSLCGGAGRAVTFRARLTPAKEIVFASALPPLLGAMLLQGWDTAQPPKPFGERAALTREAIGQRHDHTLLPETGIANVARALHRHVEPQVFERALDRLLPGAWAFWAV